MDENHPFWSELTHCGIGQGEVEQAASGPLLIGINHHLTSDRFLDHRLSLYPAGLSGGNGRQSYGEGEGAEGASATVLITGATGTLGRALERIARHRGLGHKLTSRSELDLCNPVAARALLDGLAPWAIVNAAGFVRVEDAERESEASIAANATGAAMLAELARERGIPLVSFSSDLVFDGSAGFYREGDPFRPTSVYGRSKMRCEELVLGASAANLVIRTAAFFGPWDEYNFASNVVRSLSRGERLSARADWTVSPTMFPTLRMRCSTCCSTAKAASAMSPTTARPPGTTSRSRLPPAPGSTSG